MSKTGETLSTMALIMSVLIPLYCILVTPGDALQNSRTILNNFGVALPFLSSVVIYVPKFLVIAGWLLLIAGQGTVALALSPGPIIAGLRLLTATAAAILFTTWHVTVVHLPMLVMFNALS